MKFMKMALFWAGFATGTYSAGHFVFSNWLLPAQFSSLLKILGVCFTFAGGMIGVLLKVYADLPHKDLSDRKRRRFQWLQDERLRVMWFRTALAFVLSISAAFCGWLIDSALVTTKVKIVEGIGTTVLVVGALMAVISFFEARKLSILMRKLATEMEERKRKLQALHRLEGTAASSK